MANQFKGKVTRVISKPTKTGGKLWLVAFPGDGNLFNVGFTSPSVSPGDTVEFEWKETKWGKEVVGEINVVSQGEVQQEEPRPGTQNVTGGNTTNVQDSINWQSARRDAVEVTKFLVDKGFVKLGVGKKQVDNFLGTVDEVTKHFFSGHSTGIVEARNEEKEEVEVEDTTSSEDAEDMEE